MENNSLKKNYAHLLEQIKKYGTPRTVLVAVSKTRTADEIEALYDLGHRDFGENYVQELCEKAEVLKERGLKDIRWHFIGHLQSNKARKIAPWIHTVHSLDSFKLAKELAKGRGDNPVPIPCFVEVNIDNEPTKSGIIAKEIEPLRNQCQPLKEIVVCGLMCMPSPELSANGNAFRELKKIAAGLPFLSMGMSEDYVVALQAGATHIRVGTALFGPRPTTG